MRYPDLQLTAAGAVTSVGLSLPATAAAIRAAVDNFELTDFMDALGEPLSGARVPATLPEEQNDGMISGGHQRLAHLLGLAIEECLHEAGRTDLLTDSVPILLLVGELSRPSHMNDLSQACRERCAAFYRQGKIAQFDVYQRGEAGCVPALVAVQELMGEYTDVDTVLIAGVDSWLNVHDIRAALAGNRLVGSGQAAGFVPGEAAAAILLEAVDRKNPKPFPRMRIAGVGLGEEEAELSSDEPCEGLGLASAIADALKYARLQPHDIHLRLSDVAGEEYFFEEAAMAWIRLARQPSPPSFEELLPATRIGHIGAAFGPLLLGYAWHLMRIGRAPGPNTLLHLSSANKLRGAVVTTVK